VGANYDHDVVGFNYRMTNLQAAVGCAQMEQLDTFVETKRRIRRTYDHAFSSFSSPFPEPSWSTSACWFSGFVTDADTATRVRSELQKVGVDARPTWKPMHLQAPYANAPHTSVEVSDSVWGTIVTLPCSTGISDAELDAVVQAVKAAMHQ
jgi:dTDP-4-amino-4,6-dideoxygalactose transaminase